MNQTFENFFTFQVWVLRVYVLGLGFFCIRVLIFRALNYEIQAFQFIYLFYFGSYHVLFSMIKRSFYKKSERKSYQSYIVQLSIQRRQISVLILLTTLLMFQNSLVWVVSNVMHWQTFSHKFNQISFFVSNTKFMFMDN